MYTYHMYFMMAKEAMEAGKHVACVKPFAVNVEEAGILVNIAKKKHVNAIHYNLRFYPIMQ